MEGVAINAAFFLIGYLTLKLICVITNPQFIIIRRL